VCFHPNQAPRPGSNDGAARTADDSLLPRSWQTLLHEAFVSDDAPTPAAETARLTSAMARGDEAAYHEFHRCYFDRLHRYLIVVMHGHDTAARDALQHTFLRVVRHVRQFDSEEAFWSWLTVLARSAAADEARRERRYLAALDRFLQRRVEEPVDHHDADARLRLLLAAAVAGLPDDERTLIDQKYFAGASVQDIATGTGATIKSVESRLVRIRRKLRETVLTALRHET
jgi:RNA polymerase sigma-70 factor, ECF subfamily